MSRFDGVTEFIRDRHCQISHRTGVERRGCKEFWKHQTIPHVRTQVANVPGAHPAFKASRIELNSCSTDPGRRQRDRSWVRNTND